MIGINEVGEAARLQGQNYSVCISPATIDSIIVLLMLLLMAALLSGCLPGSEKEEIRQALIGFFGGLREGNLQKVWEATCNRPGGWAGIVQSGCFEGIELIGIDMDGIEVRKDQKLQGDGQGSRKELLVPVLLQEKGRDDLDEEPIRMRVEVLVVKTDEG